MLKFHIIVGSFSFSLVMIYIASHKNSIFLRSYLTCKLGHCHSAQDIFFISRLLFLLESSSNTIKQTKSFLLIIFRKNNIDETFCYLLHNNRYFQHIFTAFLFHARTLRFEKIEVYFGFFFVLLFVS